MIIIFFVINSVLAFFFVLAIVKSKKKVSKIAIVIPILLVCVSLTLFLCNELKVHKTLLL